MTFLPIVERELRVAARRKLTYWFRIIAAGFTLLIFGGLLWIWSYEKSIAAGVTIGAVQFAILEWIAFIFAGVAGIFLTSDSLSEEKREGTLGLLFLTDLRGHDVVLGKLFSHSLQAFYGLLAAFPVLALPLLLGGVTGAEFGRAMLVICNTLFLSLTIGMFVSSVSRETLKAMNSALVITLLFLVGLPSLDRMFTHGKFGSFHCVLSIASPGYLFSQLKNMRAGDFWFQLALQDFIGWVFLGAACLCVPRAWQEKANVTAGGRASLFRRWRFGGQRARLALRRKLLPKGAAIWLTVRDRWMIRLTGAIVLVVLGFLAFDVSLDYFDPHSIRPALDNGRVYRDATGIAQILTLLLFLWVPSQACRFFVESMRNGALELMLVTPLTPRQITGSQWIALCRTFALPVVLVVGIYITVDLHQIMVQMRAMTSAGRATQFEQTWVRIVHMVVGEISLVCNLAALGWFGMWLGVNTKKTSVAVLKALCFVVVLPWIIGYLAIILCFVSTSFLMQGRAPFWLLMIAPWVLDVLKSLVFIFWARRTLYRELRAAAATGGKVVPMRRMPPLPRIPLSEPPKIPGR